MTWERAQRWLATYPVVTLAPLVAAGTVGLVVILSVVGDVVGPLNWVLVTVAAAMAALDLTLVGMAALWIGLLRWRLGLELGRTEAAAAVGCPLAALTVGAAITFTAASITAEIRDTILQAMSVVFYIGVFPLAAVCVGLRLAGPVARRKIARGQWDVLSGGDGLADAGKKGGGP